VATDIHNWETNGEAEYHLFETKQLRLIHAQFLTSYNPTSGGWREMSSLYLFLSWGMMLFSAQIFCQRL
jgi:hypothetical protein